jgi:hypothetical protein
MEDWMSVTRIRVTATVGKDDSVDRFTALLPGGERLDPPTFANLRKNFGDPEDEFGIKLVDKFGLVQSISLEPLVNVSPEAVINIVFLSGPADREFPPLESDAILLKEYLVAGDAESEE